MYETHIYYVTGPNGFRSNWLPKDRATALAESMRHQMQVAGWAGKVRVIYRDGSEVKPA